MSGPIVVLAAAIRKADTFLLTRRPAGAGHNPHRWELPGGKLEFGEDFSSCLEREIREETGLEITAGRVFGVSSWVYGEKLHIVLIGFLCSVRNGLVRNIEIDDHRWLTVEEMSEFDITEADLPLIEALRSIMAGGNGLTRQQ